MVNNENLRDFVLKILNHVCSLDLISLPGNNQLRNRFSKRANKRKKTSYSINFLKKKKNSRNRSVFLPWPRVHSFALLKEVHVKRARWGFW